MIRLFLNFRQNMGEEGEASLIYGLELQVMAFSFVGKSHSKAVVQNK